MVLRGLFGVGLLLLAGCSRPAPTPQQALALRPADARLASLYETSCKACHAHAESGALLVHDHKAWDPRWKQGLATLTDRVILGYKAMPAGGQCLTCTPDDIKALIRFMADQPETP